MTRTKKQLAQKLKAYAAEHYEDGFDSFVECYEDDELEEFVGDLETWEAVLDMAKAIVSVWEDRRADAAYYHNEEI